MTGVVALGDTPLHALMLGKRQERELVRRLAGHQGGRVMDGRSLKDVYLFGSFLSQSAGMPRIRNAQVTASNGETVFPDHPTTLFPGESITAFLRTPRALRGVALTLSGMVGDAPIRHTVHLGHGTPTPRVRHRWARRQLEILERDDTDREERVAFSVEEGVLSKHTAFLVLESEEAYRRHGIARRKAAEAARRNQKVSGVDLASLDGDQAFLGPDHIQPGDPEIRIPAPADAQSVVVVFPFGETKVAHWEPELRVWSVRFLIAHDTLDGTYHVTIRITHANGDVETLRLPYVVDTVTPTVDVTLEPHRWRRGVWVLEARQRITEAELEQVSARWRERGTVKGLARRWAHIVSDVRRINVATPDGQVIPLTPRRSGAFRAHWRPQGPIAGPVSLQIVAIDAALNARRTTLVVCPEGATCP
ncbi:MAG: hypothetical protein QF464_08645 [Myxococcota bacterium]|nr:hypothetical protein [Myxococcota bacterium]